jgi:hypothetical protein
MDNLVIALCICILLFYTQVFLVKQLGFGLRSEKEKLYNRTILKKLVWRPARHPKTRPFPSSPPLTLIRKNVADVM